MGETALLEKGTETHDMLKLRRRYMCGKKWRYYNFQSKSLSLSVYAFSVTSGWCNIFFNGIYICHNFMYTAMKCS